MLLAPKTQYSVDYTRRVIHHDVTCDRIIYGIDPRTTDAAGSRLPTSYQDGIFNPKEREPTRIDLGALPLQGLLL
jgi:hypothetical protein